MQDFTPWSSLAGGVLIGLAAALLWLGSGRIAGVSGIVTGFVFGVRGDRAWRALFLLGLAGAGSVLGLWLPERVAASPRSLAWLAAAGLCVGAGSYLGNGCTSGHGVCGVGSLSARALIATLTFVVTGMLSVALLRLLGGAS